jgi:large subunit ribosomal protein L24
MKNEWSAKWLSSKQPRKQRKYRYNAPLHIRHKLVSATLSKELRKEVGRRSVPIRKGDEVQVMRGSFDGFKGVVERVDLKKLKIYVEGANAKKVDGTEVAKPIDPSNVRITKLTLDDKMRIASIEKTGGQTKATKPEVKAEERAPKKETVKKPAKTETVRRHPKAISQASKEATVAKKTLKRKVSS